MPVRSLNSPVLKWPDAAQVDAAAHAWAREMASCHPEARCIGYFGSYARGDWGVGSDLDLVAVLDFSSEPFMHRGLEWPATRLPVPADVLVYTADEWERLRGQVGFGRTVNREVVWLYCRPSDPAP